MSTPPYTDIIEANIVSACSWVTSPTLLKIDACLAYVKASFISDIPLWTALAVPCITSTEDLPVPFATSVTLFKYPFKASPVKFLSYTFLKSVREQIVGSGKDYNTLTKFMDLAKNIA